MTELLDTTKLIVGTSGMGKTVTMKGEVEQLLKQRRHLALIDPTGASSGLRSNAAGDGPGFDIPIFGGRLGDLPISPRDGDAVARIVVEQRVSAILDLSDPDRFPDEQAQRAFVLPFLQRLRRKDRGNFHLILDEADDLCPQQPPDGEAFALVRTIRWFSKKGRLPGFVLTLVTQRPADIDKAVISQAQTIIAHRLVMPLDIDTIDRYLKVRGDRGVRDQVIKSLPELARGERWIYSPGLKLLERGVSPALETFDSSRTPEPGEARLDPVTFAQLDLSAIRAALSEHEPQPKVVTISAHAEDQVGEVRRALAASSGFQSLFVHSPTADPRDGRIAFLQARIAELEAERDSLARVLVSFEAALVEMLNANRAAIDAARIKLQSVDADPPSVRVTPEAVTSPPARPRRGQGAAKAEPGGAAVAAPASGAIRGLKALQALAGHPAGLTEQQWAWIAGLSRKGGTWTTYKGALRVAGLVELTGGRWRVTEAGIAAVGPIGAVPQLGADLARAWAARIPGTRRMVDVLIKRWPHMVTREALAADLGMATGGGTFTTYLGRLRGQSMLDEQSKRLRLAPALMGDA